MRKMILPFCALALAAVSCGNAGKSHAPTSVSATEKTVSVTVPLFNGDSAYAYVADQVAFGPRVPGSEAHSRCGAYLVEKLKSFGAEVSTQEMELTRYDGQGIKGRNVIAEFDKDNPRRVLLCAHWDSRPWADNDPDEANHHKNIDGANDGASGVGVLLEVARLVAQEKPYVGIDILFFDAEDSGTPRFHEGEYDEDSWCLGSQYWARNLHRANYSARYAILLDMVGAKNATFYREGFSDYYAKKVVDKIWRTAADLGYVALFVNEQGGYVTDDHVPVNQIAHIPCVDVIHYDPNNANSGFGDFWHTVNDNLAGIEKSTLAKVGTVIMNVIYNEK